MQQTFLDDICLNEIRSFSLIKETVKPGATEADNVLKQKYCLQMNDGSSFIITIRQNYQQYLKKQNPQQKSQQNVSQTQPTMKNPVPTNDKRQTQDQPVPQENKPKSFFDRMAIEFQQKLKVGGEEMSNWIRKNFTFQNFLEFLQFLWKAGMFTFNVTSMVVLGYQLVPLF